MKKVRKTTNIFLALKITTRPKAQFENSSSKMVLLQFNSEVIMDELHSFYSDLYSDRNNGEVTDQSCAFLETESIPKLSSVMEELCEEELSTVECFNILSD